MAGRNAERSAGRKAGIEPGDEVVDMLQPDGKPEQPVGNARLGAALRPHVHMGHGGGMGDEAFDAAEGFGEREDAHGLEEALDGRHAAGKLEAHHRPETLLLPAGERMVGMGGKAGVMHMGDRRMRLKAHSSRK